MMSTGQKLATALGSMHWTLIEFAKPLVATSDHPVVLWPGLQARRPEATSITEGVLECGEIRLPVSPTATVHMTWSDEPDDEETRVRGTCDHAANLNAFTVASADRQWFHQPDTSPPIGSGKLLPLSLELVRGYAAAAVQNSLRRAAVSEEIKKRIDSLEDADEITYFSVKRQASGGADA